MPNTREKTDPTMIGTSPDLIDFLVDLGHEAGGVALRYFRGQFGARFKDDETLVTDADLAVNRIILEHLLPTGVPVLSEETGRSGGPGLSGETWIVDPIDGTRGFAAREPEFAVHVALQDGEGLRAGLVGMPARGELYVAGRHEGAWRLPMRARGNGAGENGDRTSAAGRTRLTVPGDPHPRIAFRQRELDAGHRDAARALGLEPVADRARASGPLLMALVRGDVAAVVGAPGARVWDLAAPHAVLQAAGGRMTGRSGQPMPYRPDRERAQEGWVATGRTDHGHEAVAGFTGTLALR